MNVKQIQEALEKAGFDPGPIDGIIGRRTIRAIKEFQAKHGLKVDGIVGPKTLAKLAPSATLTVAPSEIPSSYLAPFALKRPKSANLRLGYS